MTTNSREAAAQELLATVAAAYAWQTAPSRRLKIWTDVPKATRPACFLFEGGTETQTHSNSGQGRRVIEIRLFAYIDSTAGVGATQINAIADALDVAMKPTGADVVTGRNTLGGAAYWARIDGPTLKVPGDLDGDGILMVPIKITLP